MMEKITKDIDSTKETVTQAAGLKTIFANFDFMATLKISVTTFKVLARATSWLQVVTIDFDSVKKVIDNVDNELKKMRTY